MPVIATLGAAYSANKGSASMIQAVVDNLRARADGTEIIAVSTHPAADRHSYARAGLDVDVASQRPFELALVHLPLALLAATLRRLKLPWRWVCRPRALRAFVRASAVADLSGISFVDGRRFVILIYNTLVVAVPLLLGCRVVKCSQAMGPFTTLPNRRLARLVLPRLHTICARGAETASHLRQLALTNVVPATDLAFAMEVPEPVRERMQAQLATYPAPYIVVAPSQVVDTYCRKAETDYRGIVADFIDTIGPRTGHTVVILAHSAQADRPANHMNDLPLCNDIFQRLKSRDHVLFFNQELLPTELRAVIGTAASVVTSRFHAMVSSLSERVPVLVIGWSHKYAEVLEAFDLSDSAVSYPELTSSDVLVERTAKLLAHRGEIVQTIQARLPAVRAGTEPNFAALAAAAEARQTEEVLDELDRSRPARD